MSDPKKAIVIGSGFGGLASAVRLAQMGFETTVLEKRDKPGGRAYVYKQDGFTFDAGPTVITAPSCLEDVFSFAGRKMSDYVELLPVSPFYRLLWDDGFQFDYGKDLEETLAQIRKVSPGDVRGYESFLKYSKAVYQEGYEKLSDAAFLDFWSMIRVGPQLAQLSAHRSVYSMVSKYIQHEKLRQAFSFHSLLVGGNPFKTSSIYTLIHYLERNEGVYFPRGGTGALVNSFIKLLQELGGKIRLNSSVDEIIEEKGRVVGVRLLSGERLPAEIVISNADVVHSYKHLLRKSERGVHQAKALEKKSFSMSLFLIYFGTNRTYPDVAHHTVLFGPRYKGLLKEIFSGHRLPEDFSLYLHAPTRSDSTLAPPGHEGFYVLSPVAHMGNLDTDWPQKSEAYAERILAYLEEKCLPGLRSHIVTKRIFTPLDFKTELNSHLGSAFSLEPILTQSAYFRTHNRDDRIQGLYFVGAGTHPGAGIPGVIQSAKATSRLVAEDYGLQGAL